jgi:hypothetical protein
MDIVPVIDGRGGLSRSRYELTSISGLIDRIVRSLQTSSRASLPTDGPRVYSVTGAHCPFLLSPFNLLRINLNPGRGHSDSLPLQGVLVGEIFVAHFSTR